MPDYTRFLQLLKLLPGESFDQDGYKFVTADRDLIDAKLHQFDTHHHTGDDGAGEQPSVGAHFVLDTSDGYLPAGYRFYYTYCWVDPYGNQSVMAPETYVDTPTAVVSPDAPSLSSAATGGTLAFGTYFYVLTAYTGSNAAETLGTNPSSITITSGTTNKVTLGWPTLPTGASGFNVYRRGPGELLYALVDTVASGSLGSDFVDTNIASDPNRTIPSTNTTFSTNRISVFVPGATPTVPDGYTWKIYRSTVSGDYANKLLYWVVEETSSGSGIISPSFIDRGGNTTNGSPPRFSEYQVTPPKIDLGTETTGELAIELLVLPHVVSFTFPGELVAQPGVGQWVNPFPQAIVAQVWMNLGVDSLPASQSVLADVNVEGTTVFTNQAERPEIFVGDNVSAAATPTSVTAIHTPGSIFMGPGELLSVDLDQDGGGGTPTDRDLTVNVCLLVQFSDITDWYAGTIEPL